LSNNFVIGADVGGTAVKWVAGTSAVAPDYSGEVPTNPNDIQATLKLLYDSVKSKIDCKIDLFGLACAGVIDPDTKQLFGSPNLPGWKGENIQEHAESVFPGSKVVVANDVNAALFGEWKYGSGRGKNDLAMLALGTGVGGALVVDGKLIQGSHNGAGEFGHMVIQRDGLKCACGTNGCLEAYAGARGIVQRSGTELTVAQLCKNAEAGQKQAIDLFTETGKYLAIGVGNLINILDPDLVIIGGGVAQAGDLIIKPCIEEVSRYVLSSISSEEVVKCAELGVMSAAIGVAGMALGDD
jgi:glucokinase